MVDFQQRDTSRGLATDEAEDESEAEEPAEEEEEVDVDHHHHDHHAHDLEHVGVGVLTVSSTRTIDADPSGDAIEAAVEEAGNEVVTRELVGDSLDTVQSAVNQLARRKDVDVVITTGGTGVSPDDVTVEAIEPLLQKDLPGFGELFRRLSYEDVGTKTIATRSKAGIADGVPIFALPGNVDAVELGVGEVILPEIGHIAGLARRGLDEEEA